MEDKKQVSLIAILVILIAILFVVTGFFAYQNYSLSKKIDKLSQSVNSPTPYATVTPIATPTSMASILPSATPSAIPLISPSLTPNLYK